MKKNILQILKFGIVGVIATAIDYGLMLLLTEKCSVNYLLSCAISFSVSVIINYILSVKFVYDVANKTSKSKEIIIFILLSTIGLGINQLLMWAAVEKLFIDYRISKLGTTVIVMIYNYISRKKLLE